MRVRVRVRVGFSAHYDVTLPHHPVAALVLTMVQLCLATPQHRLPKDMQRAQAYSMQQLGQEIRSTTPISHLNPLFQRPDTPTTPMDIQHQQPRPGTPTARLQGRPRTPSAVRTSHLDGSPPAGFLSGEPSSC